MRNKKTRSVPESCLVARLETFRSRLDKLTDASELIVDFGKAHDANSLHAPGFIPAFGALSTLFPSNRQVVKIWYRILFPGWIIIQF